MPDNILSPDPASRPTSDIISINNQSAILANLVLANKIFNASLAQQNLIINQQVIFQIELAALAKGIQVLLATEISDLEAIEPFTARLTEMFNQLHSKAEERFMANQKQMSELMAELQAQAVMGEAEKQ